MSDRFEEWASLFSGQLFVNLVAYVDESGRHDKTGKQKGSGQIAVAGWLDWRDNWAVFCREWKTVLDNYGAPYFHFAEWADASAVVRNIVPVNTTITPFALQNNGIAVVVPGTYLHEMLFSKEEMEHRNEAFKWLMPKGYK